MLHVLTGPACNNNCLFCMEEDRAAREAQVAAQTGRDIRAMLSDHARRDEVLFTSGEPTLNPDLLRYVGWAREEGYRVIGVISNGRLFAYPGAARRLNSRGVNRFTLSIHGHTARLHDGLTRTPGSFEQSVAGLERVLALRRERRLTVLTSTVINRRNLEHVADIHALLSGAGRGGPDLMVFNVLMPVGRGARHFAALAPRYADVAAAFARFAGGLGPDALGRVRLVDLPVCVGRDLPGQLYGEPEPFEQYEAHGSSGLQGICADPAEQGPRLQRDRGYDLTGRRQKEAILREYPAPCQQCAARPRCPGVYRRYLEAYGEQELRPVSAEALEALEAHLRSGSRERRGRRYRV